MDALNVADTVRVCSLCLCRHIGDTPGQHIRDRPTCILQTNLYMLCFFLTNLNIPHASFKPTGTFYMLPSNQLELSRPHSPVV